MAKRPGEVLTNMYKSVQHHFLSGKWKLKQRDSIRNLRGRPNPRTVTPPPAGEGVAWNY